MSTYKNMNSKDIIKEVKKKGFEIVRQKGSHITISKPGKPRSEYTVVKNSKDSYSPKSLKSLFDHITCFKD